MLEPPPSGHRKLVRRAVATCAALALATFIVGLSVVPAFSVTCSSGAGGPDLSPDVVTDPV